MKIKYFLFLILLGSKSFCQNKDLNYFLSKAQLNAPLLNDYNNQIKSNTLDSLLVRANYKTQINGNLSANFAPNLNGFGYDSAVTNGQTLIGLIGLNKKILFKSTIENQAENLKLIKETLLVNKKIALKDLNKLVIAQYIAASSSLSQIEYNEKTKSLLKNEALILKKLTQNSIYKQTDYLIFFSIVKQQELAVLQLKQQYQNDLALLNYLSGEVDTTNIVLKKPIVILIENEKNTNSIFLKQFEIDNLKIRNQNQAIDNAYKPQITFLADAGYLSSFAVTPYKNFGFNFGLGVSIPIYDGGQRKLQHQKNDLNYQTIQSYTNNFKKQFKQKLQSLDLNLKQFQVIEIELKSQLLIVHTLLAAYRKLLVNGDVQITEYTIAIGNNIAINNAIAQNNNNKLQTINEINYWNNNN
jgi:outer membrane protein TolC